MHRAPRGSAGSSSGHRARGLVVGVIAVGVFVAAPALAAADDGDAYVLSDVQCDGDGNGVLDLTLINERAALDAVFVVSDEHSSFSTERIVAPQSASAVTFTDLPDGAYTVSVLVDGVASPVAVSVACDLPEVAVLPVAAPTKLASTALPTAGSASGPVALLGGLLLAAGMAISAFARRRPA